MPAGECKAEASVITHTPTGRKTTYGKVASAAAKLEVPKDIKLKDPKDWKIVGKPLKRLDTADKLNGKKIFAIDVKLPGMLNAAIKDLPVFGSKIVSFDADKVSGMPGVRHVVKVNATAVAVVADTWWQAKKAVEALPVVYEDSPNAKVSSATIAEHLKEGLTAKEVHVSANRGGDALAAIEGAAKKIEAVYATPFLSHSCMEPMNCTAKYTPERCEVWSPTQNGEGSLAAASEASGLPLAKCEVYKTDPGGGFGRRGGAQDYVRQAVLIAKQIPGVPIKMVWSREEDMMHDFYRPISQCRLAAGLDASNNLVALHLRVSGQSINAFVNPASVADGKDDRQLQGYAAVPGDAQLGYTVPNLLIEYAMRNTHVPVGPWRGVNTNQNAVYLECFMDEVARAAGKDPLGVPPRADEGAAQAPGRAQRGCRQVRLGQAAHGRRASRHRPVHGLRQLLGGRRGGLRQRPRQGEGASPRAGRRTSATSSTRLRWKPRSRARSPSGWARRSIRRSPSRTAAWWSGTSTATR